ncbi:feline leukemia virus subgroup C receptor-related protein 2-like [Trichogramma pretiosum]|uniref:feline leukemia virus subgroup C receptor-related protein 2-like n=1 Tax=Trichogramma pretiosum TaxID=7493 RepID=UPI0006C98D1E|nr:feline leukemia virus subgroup C receptor-related protein 2-like [Trichogramma pretiosum]XP_014233939.1 feline leukemia virus subgroup C receptor-related protein 2-like [Trichogramma pretiosum]XP_014233940.1 feline leukemia virus subgroup C receptor-related protein 2-like [Trichogramma pretiosum]XP_023318710.1 feline leukemia virus subgroup C receptor-related protein 2-like [Trichogramma pretiosum]
MREDSSERLTIGNSVKVVAAANNNNGSPQHQQQLNTAIDNSSTEQQHNNGCNGQQQQQDEAKKEDNPEIIIKVYKRRWLMLSLYIFYAAIVAGQWIEYSIISNIVQRYYDVGGFAVDCTSMIFMLFYEIFIFPVTFLSERIGLRWSLVAGSALCCLGSWIKIFSVTRDGFYMTLFGQSIIAVSLVIMLILPGRVAAKWFASDELATATSLGIFGPQLGVSLSFLLPPIIVKNHVEVDDIGPDLAYMFWWIAGASTVSLVLMSMFFEEEPKLPPNATIAIQKSSQSQNKEGFMKPMKRLFTNKSFLILCNSYGINVGIFNALSTLLNPLFLMHFKNGEEDAGRIGLMIVLTGMFGSVTFGVILDRTHKFKETTVAVYFLTLCGQIFFAVAMFLEIKWMVYTSSIFLGFFMSGYLALGYELAAEYTYPESEAHSAGMLNIANNIYGIVLILILEIVLEHYSDVPVHVIFCSALFVGLIMTLVTKDEQRRQDARKSANVYQGLPIEDSPQVVGVDNARLQRQQSREDSKV